MTLKRSSSLLLITFFGIALFGAFMGDAAQAQPAYPSRPVTLVVPYPAGGSADILARLVAQKLGERLQQAVVVDNKAGAGTAIGAKAVASAAADGYTLLLGTVSSQAINPAMALGMPNLPILGGSRFSIAGIGVVPNVIVVHPDLPVKSMAAFIELAKKSSTPLTYATAGIGTSNHLAGELLASAANISLLHVPYKGSAPALNDVLAGHVPLMFDLQATALPYVQSGKLKALAVTSKDRSPLLPRVPAMREAGLPDYEVSAWFGVFAPSAVPGAIFAKLNADITAIMQAPDMQKKLRELGAEPETSTLDAYAKYTRDEAGKWAAVVKRAGLAP